MTHNSLAMIAQQGDYDDDDDDDNDDDDTVSTLINIYVYSLCPVLCSGHGDYGGGRFVQMFLSVSMVGSSL